MRVYIAGPYSKGDVALNVRAAIEAADAVAERHHCPYVSHLTHFWHLLSPKPYEWWLEYDALWLLQCEAVLRLPGESNGADQEVALATTAGIPVVHDLDALDKLRDAQIATQKARLAAYATQGTAYSCDCGRVTATMPIGRQPCCDLYAIPPGSSSFTGPA